MRRLKLKDYETAKEVLSVIFSEFSLLLSNDMSEEGKIEVQRQQAAVCEAMRQVDMDINWFKEGNG